MTREQAVQMWPIIKAYGEGKTIQFKGPNMVDWMPIDEITCRCPVDSYRVKPEPHIRPWKPEEVPVGALIHNKLQPHQNSLILGNTDLTLQMPCITDLESITFKIALACWEYSLDHGKTWLPCGVEE